MNQVIARVELGAVNFLPRTNGGIGDLCSPRGRAHTAPARRTYFVVYAALLVLLLATYAAAYADLGVLHTPIALGIAIAKALLIILFFMRVRDSSYLTRLFAAAGFVLLLFMLVITLGDFVARGQSG